jgi:hypothetical protein
MRAKTYRYSAISKIFRGGQDFDPQIVLSAGSESSKNAFTKILPKEPV